MQNLSASVLVCAVIVGIVGCSTAPDETTVGTSVALGPGASGDGQSGAVGELLALPLHVLVKQNGVPAQGVDVQWAVAPSNGAIGPAVTATDEGGIATAGWTLPTTAGSVSATASVTGAEGSPITFTATAVAGPATTSTAAGSNQTVSVGTLVGEPLSVRIADQYGNPVQGVSVAWSVVSGSATLSAAQVDTDAGGTAVVNVTAGYAPGPVVIRAIPPGTLPSSDFNLTVVP